MTALRAGFMVLFLAIAAYANSLPNGFAYDDQGIITNNPVVTGGDFRGAALGPWWQTSETGGGLYRPLTALSFTTEWKTAGEAPHFFHAGNVLMHGLVSLLLFLLLMEWGSVTGALVGAGLFAIHPLHTEAVANVVGRAELYSAFFYLLACLLFLKGRGWLGLPRGWRLLGLGLLYFLSLASKEMGVTLPGALLLLELLGPPLQEGNEKPPLVTRLWREGGVFLLLGVVLLGYLGLRFMVLGSIGGEAVAPVFEVVGGKARILTAVALWGQYLRLLLFPLDLVSDYDPGVFFPSEGLDLGVLAGFMVLMALAVIARRSWRQVPLVTLGILWFVVCISPVSNLFFSTGTLLAERTLYLPSAGLSFVAAGLTPLVLALDRLPRKGVLALVAMTGVLLFVRTVTRNPSWMSTFVVVQTLNEDHPESWRAYRGRAQGLQRVGEATRAGEAWDMAVALTPRNYTLLVEAGDFHARTGSWETSQLYLSRASQVAPELVNAYQLLAGHLLRRGMGREGHWVALRGLSEAGPDRELWALVSESYLLKGDLPAAVRAREAAIGVNPEVAREWIRLAEILEAKGDVEKAREARIRGEELRVNEEQRDGGVP